MNRSILVVPVCYLTKLHVMADCVVLISARSED